MNSHPSQDGQKYLLELKLAVFNMKYHNEQHGIHLLNTRQKARLSELRRKCLQAGYNCKQIHKAINGAIN